MKTTTLAALLFASASTTFAQTNTLQLAGPTFARPGTPVNMTVSLTGSTPAAGVQFTVTASTPDITNVVVAIGPVGTAAAKQVQCNTFTSGSLTCLIFGFNATNIANGVVANITATLAGAPTLTAETFALTSDVEATGPGISIPVSSVPVNILTGILSNCDLNGTGTVNAANVNTIVGWVLGTSTPGPGLTCDVNGDGKCNIADVEIIVAAVTGAACTAIQP